jgi:cell division protein FtsL
MIHFPTQYKRNKISGLFSLVISFFLQFNVILFIFMLYVGTQTSAEKKRKGKKIATHILPNKTNQTPFSSEVSDQTRHKRYVFRQAHTNCGKKFPAS